MGEVRPARPVKLFVGVLSAIPEAAREAEARLVATFGPSDLSGGPYPFDATHYYDEAMGTPIERRFLAFSALVRAEQLAGIKIATNEIETRIASLEKRAARPVNLDPGYLDLAKIVLASTKDFYHRILLAEGIYAEVTMHFEHGRWETFPWTFPDFRAGRYDDFFLELRAAYRKQISDAVGAPGS